MSSTRPPLRLGQEASSTTTPPQISLVAAGIAHNSSNLGMKTDWTNFAPRLGASYRATDKIVVRAGFGVSYVPFVDNTYAYNYPIKTSTFYTNTPTYGAALNPVGGYVNFVSGVPATPEAIFATDGTLTESAANGTIGLANLYIPLNYQEPIRELVECGPAAGAPRRLSSLQLAYVANHGTRISSSQNINVPSVFGESAAQDPLKIAFGKTAAVTQYFKGYSANYQSLQMQLTRPFQQGTRIHDRVDLGQSAGICHLRTGWRSLVLPPAIFAATTRCWTLTAPSIGRRP